MNRKTFKNIGIVTLAFSLVLIFINDIIDNEFLRTLSNYKNSFAMLGGIIIALSIFDKKNKIEIEKEKKMSNFYLKYIIGVCIGIIAYHFINYIYNLYLK
jgi:uncharacterized membrane protein YfcA